MVRTTDSGIVVLAVTAVVTLYHQVDELWVAFGMLCHHQYIPVHVIAAFFSCLNSGQCCNHFRNTLSLYSYSLVQIQVCILSTHRAVL